MTHFFLGDPPGAFLLNFGASLAILLALSRDPYFHPRLPWTLLVSTAFGLEAAASTVLGRGVEGALVAAGLAGLAPVAFWVLAVGLFFAWLWVNIRLFF